MATAATRKITIGLSGDVSAQHVINAASVRMDDPTGDVVNMTDALFIAQMRVGLRDANYNLIP